MKPIPFGRYQLLELIARGGMALIYRARSTGIAGFQRIVALKLIHGELARDPEFLGMFIDEAKVAAQLSHANIAQVFDLGRCDGRYYMALEHVHGRDLKQIFRTVADRRAAVPVAQAVRVAMRLLDGLDYAHGYRGLDGCQLGIVHRDISLSNVMVSFDGQVKLIDFGIVQARGRTTDTLDGHIKGKYAYMSPEQLRGLPIDPRSDLFSVGTVLFELLTGHRLFAGGKTHETIRRVRKAEVPPPRSLNPYIPERLERIVLKALARKPDHRYQSATEMQAALDGFARSTQQQCDRRGLASWLAELYPRQRDAESARMAALVDLAGAGDDRPAGRLASG